MTLVHPPLFLPDPDATDAMARRLALVVRAGDALLLQGPIGAGKTQFARALIRALTTDDQDVPSPTFTLVQVYASPAFDIWHADLYRLTHPDEAMELGLVEAFESALCLVEWPENLGPDRPEKALTLRFSISGDGRAVRFDSGDAGWAARLTEALDV